MKKYVRCLSLYELINITVIITLYYSIYWDIATLTSSVDPDQMSQNIIPNQALQCLPLIQHFVGTLTGSKIEY